VSKQQDKKCLGKNCSKLEKTRKLVEIFNRLVISIITLVAAIITAFRFWK